MSGCDIPECIRDLVESQCQHQAPTIGRSWAFPQAEVCSASPCLFCHCNLRIILRGDLSTTRQCPYSKVIAKKAHHAIHIRDRFHIMTHFNKAIDKVRAAEARELERKGLEPILKNSRWLFLKRRENLTAQQDTSLATLLQYNLKTVRSYLLKEDFQFFWSYRSAHWAGWFLDRWCTRAMRSRIEPITHVAKMLRRHRQLILNWFRAKKAFSSGIVEGLNAKAKLTTRKAYGYKTFETLELALYHNLGVLPEPEIAHSFF